MSEKLYISVSAARPAPDTVLDAFVHQVMYDKAAVVEERIRLLLAPKPRWWPNWLYRRAVRRLLTLETSSACVSQGDAP